MVTIEDRGAAKGQLVLSEIVTSQNLVTIWQGAWQDWLRGDYDLVTETVTAVFPSIIWYDHLNRTGLFEPVGTHKDHRRRGFGRAIVLYGMQQMSAAGMEFATVAHFGNNEAARGLYQACGFRPWHMLGGYIKHIESD